MENLDFKHGGNIYFQAKKNNLSVSDIIDSSASIVPFQSPKFLIDVLYKEIKKGNYRFYPDRKLEELREVIGGFHSIHPDNILPGNGASELITWVGLEASKYGKNCLPIPCFVDYERSLNSWNAEYIFKELPKKWSNQIPQTFPIKPLGEVLWITNPHNPTGQLWERKSLEKILKRYKLVICDEAFLSITPNGENQSLIPLIKNHENLIVIRSLTKLFSIAGLRLGYIVGSNSILRKINQKRDPWPLNSFAIKAGITLLKDRNKYANWTKKIHNWIELEKEWIMCELKKNRQIKVHHSATNFFLIESKFSLLPNIDYLASKGILIRECVSFRSLNDKWARISLQTHKENKKLVREIQKSFLK